MSRETRARPAKGLGVAEALDALIDALPQVGAGLKRPQVPAELRPIFAPGSLGPRHIPALFYLLAHGPMTVTDLAARLGVTLPTASAMVAELSRLGLAQRSEDDIDRRRTIVRIADEHYGTIERWLASRSGPIRRTLQQLSAAERAILVKGVRLLADELAPSAAERSGRSPWTAPAADQS